MGSELKKRYGLITAISMVVGIVIGSGIFFKATKVLNITGGNMVESLLAVAIVGIVMIICSNAFAILAARYEKVNGVVDYAEAALGDKYAYYVGWFLTIMYYPALTACLAWVSAQYTCALFGFDVAGSKHVAIGTLYLILGYAVNALSPKLAGYFQVSTTVIKLIPLILMAVTGTIVGLVNGNTVEAFKTVSVAGIESQGGLFAAVVAFAFAYEGWIIARSINAELKNAKKNLPTALVLGSIIVVCVYIAYFIGMSGKLSVAEMIEAGDSLPQLAFSKMFGDVAGSIVMAFIIMSCLGTMNGLMLGCCRGLYSVSSRGQGPAPKVFSQVDKGTNMPANSTIFGLLLCGIFYFYWQFCFFEGRVLGTINLPQWITWEPDELPIILIYVFYIPIFISVMVKEKDLHPFKRFVVPIIAIACCIFLVFCACYAYRMDAVYYFIAFAIVMFIGFLFQKKKKKA